MKLKDIKNFWEKAGKDFKDGLITPTSRDPYLGLLERKNILDYLSSGRCFLEIGCGDGKHTQYYAKRTYIFYGLDVAKSLIRVAEGRYISNATFEVGSALDIDKMYRKGIFDCVISQRCLINLSEWKYQKEVIKKVWKLLKKGGLFLLTEGFQDEMDNLNEARKVMGLSKIKVVDYNRNFRHKEFDPFIKKYFDIIEVRDYGTYLFLSRVFHPLVMAPDKPKHDSVLNKVAYDISRIKLPFEKYSYNLFYALRRKKAKIDNRTHVIHPTSTWIKRIYL